MFYNQHADIQLADCRNLFSIFLQKCLVLKCLLLSYFVSFCLDVFKNYLNWRIFLKKRLLWKT